jgi:hypothetical protein
MAPRPGMERRWSSTPAVKHAKRALPRGPNSHSPRPWPRPVWSVLPCLSDEACYNERVMRGPAGPRSYWPRGGDEVIRAAPSSVSGKRLGQQSQEARAQREWQRTTTPSREDARRRSDCDCDCDCARAQWQVAPTAMRMGMVVRGEARGRWTDSTSDS